MTVGQIAEIKDKLVENDKKLADAVKDVNDKIENGELKGEKCTIVKQVDTNSANLLSSRSRRYLAVIGSLSFIGRQVA